MSTKAAVFQESLTMHGFKCRVGLVAMDFHQKSQLGMPAQILRFQRRTTLVRQTLSRLSRGFAPKPIEAFVLLHSGWLAKSLNQNSTTTSPWKPQIERVRQPCIERNNDSRPCQDSRRPSSDAVRHNSVKQSGVTFI